MNKDITGIILAGGLSSRMGGGDKSLLELGGRTILDHVAARLSPQVAALALNANGDPARFDRFGLPVFADTVAGFAGPLAGVLAGLEWAAADTGCRAVVSAAGDTPFLPENMVERLAASAAGRPGAIAVASSQGRRHPVFALWPLELAAALGRFVIEDGKRRVSAFIEAHDFVEVDFAMTQSGGRSIDPFFNINMPGDLAEAERFLENCEP